MRNFLTFLVRYHALFLFLGMEVFCLTLFLRSTEYPNAAVLHSANVVTGGAFARYSAARNYFRLRELNDSLAGENARLRARLESSWTMDTLRTVEVPDSLRRQLYTYIPARVVHNSVVRRHNYLTLDRGRSHGVEPDMGVISAEGVIGKVVRVSDRFAVVMSLLHEEFETSGMLEEQGVMGDVSWPGRNPRIARLGNIASHVEPTAGDRVVTTGYSAIFPEGIALGTVKRVRESPGSHFLEVDVELAAPFPRLRHVYVVNYLLKEERIELESSLTDGT